MSADEPARRPFRALDVLSGSIDRQRPEQRARKQISAQLEPAQVRTLGELHARLNATAVKRIEKSDLVGLGIELLAAALEDAARDLAPAPGNGARGREHGSPEGAEPRDLDELRAYLRTYVRAAKS
jgi:hypothetical protein